MMDWLFGSVLGDGDPDEIAVKVDAARMVTVPSPERGPPAISRPANLEQMSLALSGIAIVSVAQLRIALASAPGCPPTNEEVLADLHHALRMKGLEPTLTAADLIPLRGHA
jgi:hypothetical protein